MVKSLLRYPGGKQKLSRIIVKDFCNFKEYREPFVGGGSVFLLVRQMFFGTNNNKKYWINDYYSLLYKFWKVLQDEESCFRLVNKIIEWKKNFEGNGKKLYNFLKNKMEEFSIFYVNDIESSAALYILNRITYGGLIEKGRYSESAFRDRFNVKLEKFLNVSALLKDVEITKYDFEEVIRREGEEVLIYLDPPYCSIGNLYGDKKEKFFDHERLAKSLKDTKHKWLLSYNNNDYIRSLYSFAYIKEINVTYSMTRKNGKNKKETELLITNYKIDNSKLEHFNIFSNK